MWADHVERIRDFDILERSTLVLLNSHTLIVSVLNLVPIPSNTRSISLNQLQSHEKYSNSSHLEKWLHHLTALALAKSIVHLSKLLPVQCKDFLSNPRARHHKYIKFKYNKPKYLAALDKYTQVYNRLPTRRWCAGGLLLAAMLVRSNYHHHHLPWF